MDGRFCHALGGRGGLSFLRVIVLAPHPGRVHEVFAIDLPFPRTAALRETPDSARSWQSVACPAGAVAQ